VMVTGCSCDGTVSSQGVLHVLPSVVRISAPTGSDSNFNVWSCSDGSLTTARRNSL